jgi:hypothetical protein
MAIVVPNSRRAISSQRSSRKWTFIRAGRHDFVCPTARWLRNGLVDKERGRDSVNRGLGSWSFNFELWASPADAAHAVLLPVAKAFVITAQEPILVRLLVNSFLSQT